MILIIWFEKLYNYKKIYNKVYIVYLNNGKIIQIQNIHFYKENVPGKNVKKKALFKTVFNKETEKLIFETIRFKTMFDSNESPVSQISMTS